MAKPSTPATSDAMPACPTSVNVRLGGKVGVSFLPHRES